MSDIKKMTAAFLLVTAYAVASIIYFSVFDRRMYILDALTSGINMPVPLAYLAIVAVFIACFRLITGKAIGVIAYPVLAMAIVLPLFYLLAEMKVGMVHTDPFGPSRGIYDAYASVYFFVVFSVFSLIGGSIFRMVSGEGPAGVIFHLPVAIYFFYAVSIFSANGLTSYACYIGLLFVAAMLSERPYKMIEGAGKHIGRFVSNEKLFIPALFIASLLIRYFWGVRLLGLTGGSFIAASDDGMCYDEYATMLSQGIRMPMSTMSGFGYWYFLAAVYKIFGLHNFKAVIAIQSFAGAFVPVLSYFIGKTVFKTRIAAVLAGAVMCFDMLLVFLSVVIGMEALYIPLVVLALALAVYYLNGARFGCFQAFFLGCAFGLAYNMRPPELVLFPLILAVIIYITYRKVLAAGNIARIVFCLFTGFVLLASAQFVTNYFIYGSMRLPVPSGLENTFHMGVCGGYKADENRILGQMGFDIFKDPGASLSVLARRPVEVIGLIATGSFNRLIVLYFMPNFGVFDPFCLVNPASGYLFRFPLYIQFFGYILTAAGITAALLVKNRKTGVAVLLAFLIYRSAGIALCFVLNARYRGALVPVFILFLAYGVEALYKKTKGSYERGRIGYAD